jgi:hypothetical protein
VKRTRPSARRSTDLLRELEALHLRIVEAEAFLSAFETVYGNTSWPTDGDPERRRDLNRMGCFLDRLGETLADLLTASNKAIELAMKRTR